MKYIDRSHSIVLAGPVDRVFPLFTPEGEKLWVKGWDPTFIVPEDGRTSQGMVFTTGHGDEITQWVCVDWVPAEHRVRYVRSTPASRLGIVEVRCRARDENLTEATVSYKITALTPQGEDLLDALTEAEFARDIGQWQEWIDALLAKGEAA